MAGLSLLALLDDITALLDDVSLMTKVAAKKTAGVLGDDLALNAEQVSGVRASRELPVVWSVAKGSFKNKAMLVPGALLVSSFLPWLITPLLMLGGLYLCFEGAEKLLHSFNKSEDQHREHVAAAEDPEVDLAAFENKKIKGAIRTDFILSAEIIVIVLGTVAGETLLLQSAVLATVAVLMTAFVYGLVAGIVKLDDLGLYLTELKEDATLASVGQTLGRGILITAPYLMRTLTIVGTAAMFLVGGGILLHGLPVLEHLFAGATEAAGSLPTIGGLFSAIGPIVANAVAGLTAGGLAVAVMTGVQKLRSRKDA